MLKTNVHLKCLWTLFAHWFFSFLSICDVALTKLRFNSFIYIYICYCQYRIAISFFLISMVFWVLIFNFFNFASYSTDDFYVYLINIHIIYMKCYYVVKFHKFFKNESLNSVWWAVKWWVGWWPMSYCCVNVVT